MSEVDLREYVERAVDNAPPFTQEQQRLLAAILSGVA